MAFQAGDVIRLWDATVRPPAFKRFLVVYPDEGWLLRINTKPIWRPHWALSAAQNPDCLAHDSWLELNGVIEYLPSEPEAAHHLGALADSTISDLVALLPSIATFSADESDRIVEELKAVLP